ncbi:MAG: electron transfer flavoprotein subunit beta/FixA family protein [Desulfobacula sp.]|nr:electron transfer flavoprotein subunit beta/FixA family protein [Desulfobacula sp.]
MKIFVCVKHVPDTAANIKIVDGNNFDDNVKFVVNPYDEYAIEQAVQIKKEKGGEVIIVTLGTDLAVATIRSALSMGADRGIHIKTDALITDAMTTGLALKNIIQKEGGADLVITGKQSVDTEGMQIQYRLALGLGMPVVTDVVSMMLDNGLATVECERGNGEVAVMELDMPCVIGATKGLNEPRYPKLPDILKAKRKPVNKIALTELVPQLPADKTVIMSLSAIPEKGQANIIEGTPVEAASSFVELLKEEAFI